MKEYEVTANCPSVIYEAEDEISAIEMYSENFRINHKYCNASEIKKESHNGK